MERNNLLFAGVIGIVILGVLVAAFAITRNTDPTTAAPEPVPVAAGDASKAEAKPDGSWTKTPSGLEFYDSQVGSGEQPSAGALVQVEYVGRLADDGKMFDSSFKRADSFKFPLGKGKVIKGWDEGVATMKVGGKRTLRIPGDLAYGARGRPPPHPPHPPPGTPPTPPWCSTSSSSASRPPASRPKLPSPSVTTPRRPRA
jgi:peptidylprolyl isomerase